MARKPCEPPLAARADSHFTSAALQTAHVPTLSYGNPALSDWFALVLFVMSDLLLRIKFMMHFLILE